MWRGGNDEYRSKIKCSKLQSYHRHPTINICSHTRSTLELPSTIHDDETVITNNTTTKNKHLGLKAGTIDIDHTNGIADAGATGHFLMPQAPVKNIRPTTVPLTIALPDGKKHKIDTYLWARYSYPTFQGKRGAYCTRVKTCLPHFHQNVMRRRMSRRIQRK